MKAVYIVTGNSYPASVHSTKALAEKRCAAMRKAAKPSNAVVVWAVKMFVVDKPV